MDWSRLARQAPTASRRACSILNPTAILISPSCNGWLPLRWIIAIRRSISYTKSLASTALARASSLRSMNIFIQRLLLALDGTQIYPKPAQSQKGYRKRRDHLLPQRSSNHCHCGWPTRSILQRQNLVPASSSIVVYSLSISVNRQTQPSADLLALFHLTRRLIKHTNLKYVRIIPALTQC